MSGENWNTVMYDGMKAVGWPAVFFFLALIIVGQCIIFNLFLAILMAQFEEASTDIREKELLQSQAKKQQRASQSLRKSRTSIKSEATSFETLVKNAQRESTKENLPQVEAPSASGSKSPPAPPAEVDSSPAPAEEQEQKEPKPEAEKPEEQQETDEAAAPPVQEPAQEPKVPKAAAPPDHDLDTVPSPPSRDEIKSSRVVPVDDEGRSESSPKKIQEDVHLANGLCLPPLHTHKRCPQILQEGGQQQAI
jgi:FtsZ-interacting cell division protein ZipA